MRTATLARVSVSVQFHTVHEMTYSFRIIAVFGFYKSKNCPVRLFGGRGSFEKFLRLYLMELAYSNIPRTIAKAQSPLFHRAV